jgi:hypothetical protein
MRNVPNLLHKVQNLVGMGGVPGAERWLGASFPF